MLNGHVLLGEVKIIYSDSKSFDISKSEIDSLYSEISVSYSGADLDDIWYCVDKYDDENILVHLRSKEELEVVNNVLKMFRSK